MITSNDQKYGPIGVVFCLMSYLIAIGVVIILGAVTGLVWQERRSRLAMPSGDHGRTGD
jgi:membrane protein